MNDCDYYGVLQISPGAEVEVVRAAYRHLAFKYHPDRNSEPGSQARMRLINEAYEVLSDALNRQKYDAGRRSRNEAAAATGDNHDTKHKSESGRATHPPPVPKAKPAHSVRPKADRPRVEPNPPAPTSGDGRAFEHKSPASRRAFVATVSASAIAVVSATARVATVLGVGLFLRGGCASKNRRQDKR